jgi:hypothetical protein
VNGIDGDGTQHGGAPSDADAAKHVSPILAIETLRTLSRRRLESAAHVARGQGRPQRGLTRQARARRLVKLLMQD